jgi:hypothetical protein
LRENIALTPLTNPPLVHNSYATVPIRANVRFEQEGSRLTAVEVVRDRRSPVISSLYGALLALGIVVSSYQVRARATQVAERIVMERQDGGSIDGPLTEATKAAILPIAFEEPVPVQRPRS